MPMMSGMDWMMGTEPGMPGTPMGGSSWQPPAPYQKRTVLDFIETPLEDVCEWLRDESGTNILLDAQALKDTGVDAQTPVTLQIRDMSVAGALDLLADYVSDQLGVRYEDGVAMITRLEGRRLRPDSDGWPASQWTATLLRSRTADYSLLNDSLGCPGSSGGCGPSRYVSQRTLTSEAGHITRHSHFAEFERRAARHGPQVHAAQSASVTVLRPGRRRRRRRRQGS